MLSGVLDLIEEIAFSWGNSKLESLKIFLIVAASFIILGVAITQAVEIARNVVELVAAVAQIALVVGLMSGFFAAVAWILDAMKRFRI